MMHLRWVLDRMESLLRPEGSLTDAHPRADISYAISQKLVLLNQNVGVAAFMAHDRPCVRRLDLFRPPTMKHQAEEK